MWQEVNKVELSIDKVDLIKVCYNDFRTSYKFQLNISYSNYAKSWFSHKKNSKAGQLPQAAWIIKFHPAENHVMIVICPWAESAAAKICAAEYLGEKHSTWLVKSGGVKRGKKSGAPIAPKMSNSTHISPESERESGLLSLAFQHGQKSICPTRRRIYYRVTRRQAVA